MTAPFAGRRAALLTRHGKEAVVAPVLEGAVGCRVEHIDGYDTDLLGSFGREVDRLGTQLETARRKARIGMELAGCDLGLASEGAFGPDPFTDFLPWDVELVVLLDDRLGLEIVGLAQGAARSLHRRLRDKEGLRAFAREAGFPDHQLMLRPDDEHDARIRKGLADWDALAGAFAAAAAESAEGWVFVENDLRAFCNPTRMAMIRSATENLAARLNAPCPACGTPGFWITGHTAGLPCGLCGAPTRLPRSQTRSCLRCRHREERPVAGPGHADPSRCDHCNP
jgi:hypothetical protein